MTQGLSGTLPRTLASVREGVSIVRIGGCGPSETGSVLIPWGPLTDIFRSEHLRPQVNRLRGRQRPVWKSDLRGCDVSTGESSQG